MIMYTIGSSCVSVLSDRSFVCLLTLLCVRIPLVLVSSGSSSTSLHTLAMRDWYSQDICVCCQKDLLQACDSLPSRCPVTDSQEIWTPPSHRSVLSFICSFIYLSVVFVCFLCWVGCSQCGTTLVLDVCFSPVAELILRFYIMNKLNKCAEFILTFVCIWSAVMAFAAV